MTARQPCPPAPRPLEAYAAHFDPLFRRLAQRREFRAYLAGLLAPRDRNKTLTALAGAEPVVQAQAPEVQRLQFFLSEAAWDVDAVTEQRIALLLADPLTVPHAEGVLVLDDTGDRKDGTATDHVARQYLGSVGKIDNGIVAVTSLWADARVYYPLHVEPYTPAGRLDGGKRIRASAPSHSSPSRWSSGRARSGSRSVRRWLTAPTATMGSWRMRSRTRTSRTCWPTGGASAVAGPPPTWRTASRRPSRTSAAATGPSSGGASGMGIRRRGGPPS